MTAKYQLRLMFEWSGGCLWCGNDAARDRFDVGPIEDVLPLSETTRSRLQELAVRHDTALDWDNPTGPSPWSAEERAQFESAAEEALALVQSQLGDEFEVTYVPL